MTHIKQQMEKFKILTVDFQITTPTMISCGWSVWSKFKWISPGSFFVQFADPVNFFPFFLHCLFFPKNKKLSDRQQKAKFWKHFQSFLEIPRQILFNPQRMLQKIADLERHPKGQAFLYRVPMHSQLPAQIPTPGHHKLQNQLQQKVLFFGLGVLPPCELAFVLQDGQGFACAWFAIGTINLIKDFCCFYCFIFFIWEWKFHFVLEYAEQLGQFVWTQLHHHPLFGVQMCHNFVFHGFERGMKFF